MNTVNTTQNGVSWVKFLIAFVACILFRLIPPPFRAPNVEPILSTVMPFAKNGGALVGFLFAALSMVVFDFVSGYVGAWTIVTALTYGLIGAAAPYALTKIQGVRGYVSYAVFATLVFDGITGVLMGPLLTGQSFAVALAGQIPFTAMHLVGNMTFALTLSPLIEVWIVKNEALNNFFARTPVALRG